MEIDSTVEKVWNVLTDPQHWPQWFPGVESVSNVIAVQPGSTFSWTRERKTGECSIEVMEPLKEFKVLTQLGDDKDSHSFKLRASGGFLGLNADECKVEYTLDTLMGGGILGSFFAGGNPVDAIKVKKAMLNFRKLVESI